MNNKNTELATSATSKIYEKVNNALAKNDTDKRWFWELLQNAKDTVVLSKGKVDIKVIIDNNKNQEPFIRFEHNGGVFKYSNHRFKFDDPKCLLLADSGKIEEDETQREDITGQFGTGFLSTHILSLRILVEGVFLNRDDRYYNFSFELDRRYNGKFDLAEKVEKSLNQYDEDFSLSEKPKCEDFHTKFTYFLNENKEGLEKGLEIVRKGINGIETFIPYVLAFCREVNSVEICDRIDNQNTTIFRRLKDLETQDNQVQIIQVSKEIFDNNNNQLENKLIEIALCSNSQAKIDLAIEVQKTADSYKIIPINQDLPILFCTFPLIGSEEWRFPVVLNCTKFYPKSERDGILLLTGKDNGNQNRIENTLSPYKALLDFAISQKWENLYWLAKTDYDACPKWTSETWYRGVLQKKRSHLITQKLVLNSDGNYLMLSEALFPTFQGKEKLDFFWDICNEFIPEQIPKKSDIDIWNKIINKDYSTWQTDFKYNLERLLKEIENEINLVTLAKSKFSSEIDKAIHWLNKVISFLFEQAQKPDLLKKYAILPNKNNVFKKVGEKENRLHSDIDAQIPNEIINIYKKIGDKDWADYLLNPKIIISDIPEIPKYGITHISQDIDNIISAKTTNQSTLRKAIYQIISYYSPSFEKEDGYADWRKKLWKFTRDLDNTVPEVTELEGLTTGFWKKADEWLLLTLIQDIQTTKDIETLQQKLSLDTNERTLKWLNDFIYFYIQNKKETYYSEKAIFPNQKGILRKKQELFIDKGIPEELKEILDRVTPKSWSFTNILLDSKITCLIKHQSKSTKEISTKINDLINIIIKNNFTDSEKDTNGFFKKIIFDLTSFTSENLFPQRKQLFDIAYPIFGKKISDTLETLPTLDDFDFTLINEWILKDIVVRIAEMKSLDGLQNFNSFFNTKEEKKVLEWLDTSISFIASFEEGKHFSLLNRLAVIPNQNNNFCLLKSLKRDDNIPNDLKEIASAKHIRQDWNDWLLHKDLAKVNKNLFDENTTTNLKQIADEIDSHVRDYKSDKQNTNFAELIFLLNQSETVKNDVDKKYFPYFLNNRDMLIVGTLGEGEDLENVATILQDRNKLDVFAKISKSTISISQLEAFLNAVELVGADDISNLVGGAKEEQEKIDFHTMLGELAEQIFREELEQLGFIIERTGYGSDFEIIKGNFNCLIEIKSFVEKAENFVKMTPFQAKTAVESDNYVLCVFPKSSVYPTKDDFKTKAKFVTNISESLETSVSNASELEKQKERILKNQIGVFFEEWQYKYKISEVVWQQSKNLEKFIEYLHGKV